MAIYLNVGCGDRRLPGFIHMDWYDNDVVDAQVDIMYMPVRSDSVDMIYASHVLEHVRKPDVPRLLREWRNLLKPHTGVLRLSVPDFRAIADLYLNHGVAMLRLWGLLCGKQDYDLNVHYTWWDYELLAYTLQQNGFYNICTWCAPSVHPHGYNDFSLGRVNGRLISLNVEAIAS